LPGSSKQQSEQMDSAQGNITVVVVTHFVGGPKSRVIVASARDRLSTEARIDVSKMSLIVAMFLRPLSILRSFSAGTYAKNQMLYLYETFESLGVEISSMSIEVQCDQS